MVAQVVVVLEGSEYSESYSNGSGFNDACVQVSYCDLWCCQSNIECNQSNLSIFNQLITIERYQSCRGSKRDELHAMDAVFPGTVVW